LSKWGFLFKFGTMSIKELYEIFQQHPKISTDSRLIEKDCLFFALKGENFNGNEFGADALKKGAAYSIIDEELYKSDERCILVENVLNSLQELSRYHREQLGIPILAITGTNGKTTTKELVASVLSKKFNLTYTKGNLNNHIGVPVTLLSMNTFTEFGIIEMGANHPGEIGQLCQIALPDYGLITNVGCAHLEGFGSFEGVKNAKAELYRFLENRGGRIFVNSSNPDLISMAEKLSSIYYNTGKDTEGLQGELAESSPFIVFRVKFKKGWLYIKTHLIGDYNLENALAAVCVGNYFGIDPLEIKDSIENCEPSNNRSQYVKTEHNRLMLDAYNANPTSMKAALKSFSKIDVPKKAVILGDMWELGNSSPDEHQKIVDLVASMGFSLVLLSGEQFSKCRYPQSFSVFANNSLLSEYLDENRPSGYLFLIKGSRGMKLENVMDKL
jgi:UDP-N-acetylmuramoyl-tripeptide--D-alanyl-D-alanine ligase